MNSKGTIVEVEAKVKLSIIPNDWVEVIKLFEGIVAVLKELYPFRVPYKIKSNADIIMFYEYYCAAC